MLLLPLLLPLFLGGGQLMPHSSGKCRHACIDRSTRPCPLTDLLVSPDTHRRADGSSSHGAAG